MNPEGMQSQEKYVERNALVQETKDVDELK